MTFPADFHVKHLHDATITLTQASTSTSRARLASGCETYLYGALEIPLLSELTCLVARKYFQLGWISLVLLRFNENVLCVAQPAVNVSQARPSCITHIADRLVYLFSSRKYSIASQAPFVRRPVVWVMEYVSHLAVCLNCPCAHPCEDGQALKLCWVNSRILCWPELM